MKSILKWVGLVVIVVIFSGCSSVPEKQVEENTRRIEVIEEWKGKNEAPERFKLNQECHDHLGEAKELYESNITTIETIFYSPKARSCLYESETFYSDDYYIFNLSDVFTNELVVGWSSLSDTAVFDYDKHTAEYK